MIDLACDTLEIESGTDSSVSSIPGDFVIGPGPFRRGPSVHLLSLETPTNMEFVVSRKGRTLVTLHEGTDTTARDAASAELGETFAALDETGAVSDWSLGSPSVYEHPTAPFEPYTISVPFAVTVAVEAESSTVAIDRGLTRIEAVLRDAEIDGLEYTSPPEAVAA